MISTFSNWSGELTCEAMLTYVQLVTEMPDDNAALSLRLRSKYRLFSWAKITRQGIKIG